MQRNKYLEKIGIPIDEYGVNMCDDLNDARQKCWKEEQEKYGFDRREVWELDRLFVEWLYSHLKMYKKVRKNSVPDHLIVTTEYPDAILSFKEGINLILKACKKWLLDEDYEKRNSSIEMKKAIKLFADISSELNHI